MAFRIMNEDKIRKLEKQLSEKKLEILNLKRALKLNENEVNKSNFKKLKESKQKYKNLLNNIRGIIWEADPETFQTTFISKQAEVLLGYPISEWLENTNFWESHLHPDDKKWAIECYGTAIKMNKSLDFEYRMIASDGRTIWLHDYIYIEKGISNKLNGVMVDVTEKVLTNEKLQIKEAQYYSLFNLIKDGIYRSTPDGKFIDINPAMVSMFGYESKEEMLSINIPTELYFSKDERDLLIQDSNLYEYQLQKKDGTKIWVEDHDHYIYDENKNVIFHEGVLRNISERKQN